MPHSRPRQLRQAALLATLLAPVPAFAGQFEFTDAGPYEYTDVTNWVGEIIGNNWTSSLTADQTITFNQDYLTVDPDGAGSASATLNIANTGTFNHTFIGSGANRTLTLGGNISLGSSSTNANKVTIGSTNDGQRLNIDLGTGGKTFTSGTNRTLEVVNVISGTGGLTATGAGTIKLNSANSFAGSMSLTSGVIVEVTELANGGQNSSIGKASNNSANLSFGGTSTATLRYVGSGHSTDRRFNIGGASAIFDASGSGAINWTNSLNPTYSSNSQARTITFRGTSTHANTMGASLNNSDSGTGITSILKDGTGRWILTGNNTYTGTTTIDAGTLEIGASNRISDSSNMVLNGGTFATGGFSETLGTLDVNGNAIIDLGSGDSDLIFADSSAIAWGASISLSIINFTEGVDSIRFGINQDGLTLGQLGAITINGQAASIDELGYLGTIPEPSSYAVFAGAGALLLAFRRRSRDN